MMAEELGASSVLSPQIALARSRVIQGDLSLPAFLYDTHSYHKLLLLLALLIVCAFLLVPIYSHPPNWGSDSCYSSKFAGHLKPHPPLEVKIR
jgi:hypothetical protein